jgi:hypothetical protein
LSAAKVLALMALVTTVIAGLVLLLVDTYSGETCMVTPEGVSECHEQSATLAEINGAWVLGYLAIPVFLTATTLALVHSHKSRTMEWIFAAALLLLCVIAIFSIGLFYLPSALLLIAAVIVNGRARHVPVNA